MDFFDSVEEAPDDPILSIPQYYAADPRPNKVNLGVGAYRNAEGQPQVLGCVRRAENRIAERRMTMEYLPMEGDMGMVESVIALALGAESLALSEGRIKGVQTLGGSGALSLAAKLLRAEHPVPLFLPDPSWLNHRPIFTGGGLEVQNYPHLNRETLLLDFKAMTERLQDLEPGTAVLFHACCHNPSGINPTNEQWKQLSLIVKEKKLLPIFDCAYQGFGKGLNEDAFALRHFEEQGHEMLIAISCSKNFGLYGQRAGCLAVLTQDPEKTTRIYTQLKRYVRETYSSPPRHAANIVKVVLRDLRNEWIEELTTLRERIQEMRKALHSMLQGRCEDKDLSFFAHQEGMFSYTGLGPDQVRHLKEEKALYMAPSGRINVAGLNWGNLEYVADSLAEAYGASTSAL